MLDADGKGQATSRCGPSPTPLPRGCSTITGLKHNRQLVADASHYAFGYLHTRAAMAMPNFRKFEEELVSQGAGKDGLVIDVRENPGGSITDHLLTALTQPNHAITVPRGGGPGYPLDRKVYIFPGTNQQPSSSATKTPAATPRSLATRSRR